MREVCKACGAKFEFIEGPAGTPIPVQRVRTVYHMKDDKLRKTEPVTPEGGPVEKAVLYVSHFETCSDPGRFSR